MGWSERCGAENERREGRGGRARDEARLNRNLGYSLVRIAIGDLSGAIFVLKYVYGWHEVSSSCGTVRGGGESGVVDTKISVAAQDPTAGRIGEDIKLTARSTTRSVIDVILATTHSRCCS